MAVKTRGGPRVAGPVLAAQSPIPTTSGSEARRSGLVERYLQCEFTRLDVAI